MHAQIEIPLHDQGGTDHRQACCHEYGNKEFLSNTYFHIIPLIVSF
jgi:hypothetical protein